MKKYPSKINYGLFIFILIVLIGSSIPLIAQAVWPALLINGAVLLFVAHLYRNTYYIIDNRFLKITSGVLITKKIEIQSITGVAETKTIISAPALSFDRLEISYGQGNSVVISPKDKAIFIAHLFKLNPQINMPEQD